MEVAKKVLCFSGSATKREGGGGVKVNVLVAGPQKNHFFCGFPYLVLLLGQWEQLTGQILPDDLQKDFFYPIPILYSNSYYLLYENIPY